MFCTEIDLTSSLHIHAKYRLRLEVTASARVSLPRPDSVFLTSLTLPEIFTSRDTWVSLGPELKLTVDTYLNGTVRGSGQPTLALGDIGEILGYAELWSNLGLVTSQQDPGTIPGALDTARFIYTIQPDLTVSQSSQARKASFPKHIHEVNVQPPEGIPTAVLQEIKVSLHFLPIENRSKPLSYPKIKQGDEGFDDLLFALDYFDPGQFNAIGIPEAMQQEFQMSQDTPLQYPHTTENYCEYLEDDSPFSSQESQLSCPRFWQDQLTKDNMAEKMDIEPYITLIDSGFRSLICDKPIRTAAGIKTHFDEPGIKLADAVPAVFSPRYLSAMSQRAGYVPMIAKSINAMLEKTSSTRLKERYKILGEAYRARAGTASDGTTTGLDTRSTLKCLLWMSLQRGVYDPGAARRLGRIHDPRQKDEPQPEVEVQPAASLPSNNPDSDPMIDISDDIPFELPENYARKPAHEDLYDDDEDLLFSELGLYEADDDQLHGLDPFDDNLHLEPDTEMNDEDLFDHLQPQPTTPYSDINIDIDIDILDPATSPPPHNKTNIPTLPIPLSSEHLIQMDDDILSSPPLSILTDPLPEPESESTPIFPNSDTDIPPSSPPLQPSDTGMLLS